MKITILSKIDYAGSAYKLCEALLRHTDHDVNLYSGKPENNFNHPVRNLVTKQVLNAVQQRVNDSDILHFKGDWPPENGYLSLQIPDKPIVLTTSGSFFRKKMYGGIGKYSNDDYGRVTLKTSFETDLLYEEYSHIWTPQPIDSDDKPMIWNMHKKPYFLHIPSSPEMKGTEFVRKVFAILKREIDCDTDIITGITFQQSVELKRKATVYFDQFVVGFYGNSALEAMQWGIPVCAWLSPRAIYQAHGRLDGCPIINRNMKNAERTADAVLSAIRDETLGRQTKVWCDTHHGYRAVAKQWNQLYSEL